MKKKPFQLGIIVGRFQTFHLGHEDMIRTAVALCDEVGVFIGSSQESGTYKNPFTYEQRKEMLKALFGDSIRVYPLPDIGVGNNAKWGDYVLKNVQERFGRAPDLLISGKEERRLDWFDSVAGLRIAELYIPKTIDISATQMREWLIADNRDEWRRYTPQKLWNSYESMREAVLSAKENTKTDSI